MHETVYPELSGTRLFLENSADHHCIIILHHQDIVVIQTQAKSTENSKFHTPLFDEFSRSSRDLCHYGGYNAVNLGTICRTRPKVACQISNFKLLKNREDSSDFWTESIASAQNFFPQIFARTKIVAPTKILATSERAKEQTKKSFLPRYPQTKFN